MKTLSKALIGTVAAGAMAVSAASPAFANDRNRDGVSAGEIIAGALIIGGIAAVAGGNRGGGYGYDDYRYDRAGYDRGYGYDRDYDRSGYDRGYGYRQGNPRQAVEQCVRTAERQASQYSYGRADVTDIRSVRNTRHGFEVRGRIAVNGQGRDWRNGDNRYGSGWGNDYRGWNDNLRGYDSGSFKCKFEHGRVIDIDINGLHDH